MVTLACPSSSREVETGGPQVEGCPATFQVQAKMEPGCSIREKQALEADRYFVCLGSEQLESQRHWWNKMSVCGTRPAFSALVLGI